MSRDKGFFLILIKHLVIITPGEAAAKGCAVGNPLPPLRRPVAEGGRRWGRRRKALQDGALLADRIGPVRIRSRQLSVFLSLFLNAGVNRSPNNLASEGAETERVEETSFADLAGVDDALARPRLGPLVEEDDASAVDDVSLHGADVQYLLYFRNPYDIVV